MKPPQIVLTVIGAAIAIVLIVYFSTAGQEGIEGMPATLVHVLAELALMFVCLPALVLGLLWAYFQRSNQQPEVRRRKVLAVGTMTAHGQRTEPPPPPPAAPDSAPPELR